MYQPRESYRISHLMVIIFVALVGYYFVNQYFKAPEPTTMPKKTTSRSKTSYAPKKQTQRQGVYHAPRIPQFAVQTYTAVTCNKERNESRVGFSNYISSIITDISNSTSKSIRPHCPCAWDPTGRCRQAAHMCYGPNSTYICTFVVRNATVTSLGAVLGGQTNSPEALTLRHETLCGGHAPQYEEHLVNVYTDALSYSIEMFRNEYKRIHHRVDKLIPIRTRWDDCFNHLSFQSMPLIGLVYEFHPELFYSAHWQTSRFTAAILLLLGVNAEKLIIEESALANEVWLPWMQYWNPYNTLPLPGISRGVSLLATEKLLQKKISATVIKRIDPLIPLDYKYAPLTLNTSVNSSERYVVYLNRTAQHTRNVVNELAILQAIQENLKDGYRLVVLPSMKEVRSIEEMHGRWQQFARILKHAIVIMGPHGGAMNNLMWTPDDCDLIEFNENPDDEHVSLSHGQLPVRRVFMSAFLAKSGNTNRYWTIQPVKRHFQDFYTGRLKVLVRDVLQVLSQVKHNGVTGLLKNGLIWETMETEGVGIFGVGGK